MISFHFTQIEYYIRPKNTRFPTNCQLKDFYIKNILHIKYDKYFIN